MKKISTYPLYLASKSPRRATLLQQAHLDFHIVEVDVEEVIPLHCPIDEVAERIAMDKADAVSKEIYKDGILLTADTVVIANGEILGKPNSEKEAIRVLATLSDRKHHVITGVCMRSATKQELFSVRSNVEFIKMDDDEIKFYVEQYAPMDKAGSYGIQEWVGWCKISAIEGSYANIMGLPIHEVYNRIKNWKAL